MYLPHPNHLSRIPSESCTPGVWNHRLWSGRPGFTSQRCRFLPLRTRPRWLCLSAPLPRTWEMGVRSMLTPPGCCEAPQWYRVGNQGCVWILAWPPTFFVTLGKSLPLRPCGLGGGIDVWSPSRRTSKKRQIQIGPSLLSLGCPKPDFLQCSLGS